MTVVSDTSPLSALASIHRIDLLLTTLTELRAVRFHLGETAILRARNMIADDVEL